MFILTVRAANFSLYDCLAVFLCSNHTLLSMPMPFHDAAQSLKPQTEQNLRKVSSKRNKGPEWEIKKDHCLETGVTSTL